MSGTEITDETHVYRPTWFRTGQLSQSHLAADFKATVLSHSTPQPNYQCVPAWRSLCDGRTTVRLKVSQGHRRPNDT